MPYNNAIPQPADILSDSQDDILQNFIALNTAFSVNHVAYNAAGQGKHAQVTLPENAAPTNTLIDEANIYSQLSALTAQTELAWQRENNGARIEWTGALAATNGWTRLPSGILIKWGGQVASGFNSAFLYPVAATMPVFVTVFITLIATRAIVITPNSLATLVNGSQTNVGFSTNGLTPSTGLADNVPFNYVSIGT